MNYIPAISEISLKFLIEANISYISNYFHLTSYDMTREKHCQNKIQI